VTRILLVRHGETEWNRVERFRGRADVPLNERGIAQAEATGRRIASQWKPTAVYASPLSRAARTAEVIARHFGLSVQAHAGFINIHYGEWQGLSPDEVRERWPEMLRTWYEAPQAARIPGGETLDEVRARGLAAVNELAARHEGETIALVGHTGMNRAILLGVLGLPTDRFWRLRQDTCAVNVFEADRGDFTVVTLNDTCHLHPRAESAE